MSATREATVRPTRAALGSASVMLALGFAACDRAPTQPPEAGGADREVERGAGYTFTLDGKPFSPDVLSLNGTPDDPREGDVIGVRQMLVVLGPPGRYEFRFSETWDRLFCSVDGGEEGLAGIHVAWRGEEGEVTNSLADMKDPELRGLRSVNLDAWPEGMEETLSRIDIERAFINIENNATVEGDSIPPVPDGIRYLCVPANSETVRDFSRLSRMHDLRLFVSHGFGGTGPDIGRLSNCRSLRYLSMVGGTGRPEAVGALKELRALRISWADSFDDIRFVEGMTQLRSLELVRTAVTDLRPLGGLGSLERIDATASPVSKLPAEPMPALRELRVLSTKLADEEIAAFREANPACRIVHRWVEVFREALAGATRIRVRTGGTCHTVPEEETTLFEMEGADEVARFVGRIEIDDARSGGSCMCCGSPTFEVYRGEELVAALGFHHGRSLRWADGAWADGAWPGDALLTPESAGFLCDWLAEHGVTGPKDERDEGGRQQAAAERRGDAYGEIIPRAVGEALNEAGSAEEIEAAFAEGVPDEVARAEMYLKLFGADEASWNVHAGFDEPLAERLLPGVGKAAMAKAILNVRSDRRGSSGAARWLFSEEKWREVDPAALEEALSNLAARGLSHGRSINRRRTARALGEIGSPTAREALRSALAGEIVPDKLAGAELDEPGGMVSYKGGDSDAPDDCTDRAYAALVLARTGDGGWLPAVRALAAEDAPEDRKTLERAIRLLEGKDEYEELD